MADLYLASVLPFSVDRYVTDVGANTIMCEQPYTNRPNPVWCALYTRSHCEQVVCDQLAAKGFHLFLITQGSLQGVEGILLKVEPTKGC